MSEAAAGSVRKAKRICARAMADRGMMDEVNTLLAKGYDDALPAMAKELVYAY